MAESLGQKFDFLAGKLAEWGNCLEAVRSVANNKRWGYRSKTTLNARWLNGQWLLGMMSRSELVPIHDCPVHAPIVNTTVDLLRRVLPPGDAFPLAFMVQSAAQVVLVVKARGKPDCAWLTPNVKQGLSAIGIEGLWLHLNPSAGRRIFEKGGWFLLCGNPRSVDANGLYYGPGAFQQLIPELYSQSLQAAYNHFMPLRSSAIVDLYCGTGTSMRKWIDAGAQVIGVELGGEAVACAKLNAPEALVLRGACRQRIPQVAEWAARMRDHSHPVMLYANPPRTGLEPEVLTWIVTVGKPDRIAYLSCSAGTLSKNLAVLCVSGYRVTRLIPFDFFPQTIHVECLALLERTGEKTL